MEMEAEKQSAQGHATNTLRESIQASQVEHHNIHGAFQIKP